MKTDELTITVEAREVYGHTKYYPLCDKAKTFAAIANTTTITEAVVKRIKALGYTVQVQTTMPEFL
jgi:hypothetical protein